MNIDLRVLNIWAEKLSPTQAFIFSYIKNKFESRHDIELKNRKNNLTLIEARKISEALPILNSKDKNIADRTIRAHIKSMTDSGLLIKENYQLNGSKRLYCGISQYYYEAESLAKSGLTTEKIKNIIFPDGYKSTNLSEVKVQIDKNGRFTSMAKNSHVVHTSLNDKKLPYLNGKITPYINSNYKLDIKKGDINSIKNSPPNLENKNLKQRKLLDQISNYAIQYNKSFKIVPALESKIRTLVKTISDPNLVFDLCKEYLDLKKAKLNIFEVVSIEFIDFLEKKTKEKIKKIVLKVKCPACGRLYNQEKHYCRICSYDDRKPEEWKKEHIFEMKSRYVEII